MHKQNQTRNSFAIHIPLGVKGDQKAVWCLAACQDKPQQSFWHPTWGSQG